MTVAEKERPDFRIMIDLGMGLLIPVTPEAEALAAGDAFGDVVKIGQGIGVDRRYLEPLIENLRADGWVVEININ
jgi:hypothetical protein